MKLKIEDNEIQFIESIEHDFTEKIKHNKLSVEKQAAKFSISNKNEIKELAELAIVRIARSLITSNVYQSFQNLVKLYEWQANLSHRTSQSMILQQYSTPVPISFLASQYVKSNEIETYYFEPSAGNGLLTIALPYESIYVNELDDVRLSNLKTQPFLKISSQDATLPFPDYYHCFDGIITNPPFGTLLDAVDYDSFPIKTLDHLMALRALDCMKDNGKAAIIIGGHTDWDEKGRIQLGKNRIFFNYLYSHYNVEDVILIDGHKLYSRQGTAFDVRLILINGRKKTFEGVAPLKNASLAKVVNSFDELWERISIDNITVNADAKKNENFATSNNDNKIDNYLAAENNKQQNLTQFKDFVFKNMGSYKFWIEETKGKPLLSYTEDEIISFLRALNLNQLVGVGSKETRVNKIAQMLIWNFAKKEDDSNLTLEQYAIAHFIEEAKTEAFMFSEALLVPIEDYRSAWEKKKKIIKDHTTYDLLSQQKDKELSHARTKNKLKLKMKLKAKALELLNIEEKENFSKNLNIIGSLEPKNDSKNMENNKGDFGTIYTQFKGKAKKAIKHLIKVKEGECIEALYREDIGFIDIVWGEHDKNNRGFGLKHIIEKHGNEIKQMGFEIEDFIPIVVQYGDFNEKKSETDKKVYESKMFRFVIAINNKSPKKWLLTAFDLRKKPDFNKKSG